MTWDLNPKVPSSFDLVGLPKKERCYRPDIGIIVGLTENQVRYAVKVGRILVEAGVDAWGRPFWAEEEVEVVTVRFDVCH